jgi:hypothetical protein
MDLYLKEDPFELTWPSKNPRNENEKHKYNYYESIIKYNK